MAIIAQSFLRKYDIETETINISRDADAHQKVVEINNGFASVPTFVFPDGTTLTEPSMTRLAEKLGLELNFKQKLLANFGL